MTGRARLAERLALMMCLSAGSALAVIPEPLASGAAGAEWVPWPLGKDAGAVALSGGLAVLRAKGSRMIRVPAAEFVMGSTPDDVVEAMVLCRREPLGGTCDERSFSDELSAHRVRLSGFFLDRREVSVADYQACVRVGQCKAPPYDRGAQRFQQPNLPVSLVTWDDAQAFCAFRGARLPTEAEFERAARGRTGRRFPWGELVNDRLANHGRMGVDASDDGDGYAELAPVGSYNAGRTPDGFLDLAGNVAEWVRDRYAPQYPEGDATDPVGPDASLATSARVVRGGSYESPLAWLRGATRGAYLPGERRPSLGFRCALSQQGPRR